MTNLLNFKNKNILLTGGSGYLAKALIPRLIGAEKITCVARNEGKLLEIKQQFNVEILTGDISDRGFVERIMKGQNCIFHLAGFKHLPLAEQQSQECINTNVIGSKNILDASLYSEPDFIIGISSDKAYNPVSCYGMTKRLMEYLFAQYQRIKGTSKTEYRIVRYGNVLGSTGSVIPVWHKQGQAKENIKLTGNFTRFFFSVDDAVNTLFDCLNKSKDATPFIPNMKAISVHSLAEIFTEHYKVSIDFIGNRGGEKINEEIAEGITSDKVYQMSKTKIKEKLISLNLL